MNIVALLRVAAISACVIGLGPARAREAATQLPVVISKALPSVVSITTKSLADANATNVDLATAHATESFGSGFIVDPAGYIATNRHVVDGAFDIIVTLSDGTRLSGNVVGRGRKYDIALVKVDARRPLQAVTFADSMKLNLGDEVVVIGNPYGLGISASSGIVSALSRNLGLTNFDRFIQTDAAINHGNSGGPVFDLKGRVVGMSTALYTGGVVKGGSIGIGFAIPSSIVRDLLGIIRQYGYLRVGSFEVDVRAITPEIAAALGIADHGVIVVDVRKDGPAAGILQPGDVVLMLDGRPVRDRDHFYTTVGQTLEKNVAVKVWRAGAALDLEVRAVQWADEEPIREVAQHPSQNSAMPMHFGVNLAPITDETRTQFNLARDQQGLVVTAVMPNTPGAAAGFSVGDVIERAQVGAYVQGVTPGHVMSPDEIVSMVKAGVVRMSELKKTGWPYVVVLVRGSGGVRFVTMSLADWVE